MRALLISAAVLLLGAAALAQHTNSGAASSATYFVAAAEFGSGELGISPLYRAQGSQGSGVVVEPAAASSTYRMRGGFFGALTSPMLGKPWLTGARPLFVKPSGNPSVTLHGTELWLGPTPTVTVGGVPASVVTRTVDRMVINLPPLAVPGYQPVVFSNSAGTAVLPEGLGVLPMLEKREPLNGVDRNYLRIHTLQFDIAFIALGLAPAPGIQVLDFQYQLLLDPFQVVFTDAFLVTDPDGKTTIPLPPYPSGQLWVQVLAITADPSYTPGRWTNAVAL